MGSSYLFGLALYTLRIPERFFPGKFDILVILFIIFRDTVTNGGTFLCF